jgi:hypothetical protein
MKLIKTIFTWFSPEEPDEQYLDFEVKEFDGTIIDAFSVSKKEFDKDPLEALRKELIESLEIEVQTQNLRISLTHNEDPNSRPFVYECVKYFGTSTTPRELNRYRVIEIPSDPGFDKFNKEYYWGRKYSYNPNSYDKYIGDGGTKQSTLTAEQKDMLERDMRGFQDDWENWDPYTDGCWGQTWFCIKCGGKLLPIAKDDKDWNYLWETMKQTKCVYFLCAEKECEHANSPLTLFNPTKTNLSGPGESYAIGWIK